MGMDIAYLVSKSRSFTVRFCQLRCPWRDLSLFDSVSSGAHGALHALVLFICTSGKSVMEDAALRSLPVRLGERHVPARPRPESNSHRHPTFRACGSQLTSLPLGVEGPRTADTCKHTFSAFWL